MDSQVAALLYLLGRRVTTALRVRRENEEIVLNRHQAPPLRELHDALAAGEQVAIDPWVDLDDGSRAMVCLWVRTSAPAATTNLLPPHARPQLWVTSGPSALLIWLLNHPSAEPGGADPARAMREIAGALGAQGGDPRDYIPVPVDAGDVVIIDPDGSVDAAGLVQWAREILAQRAAEERRRREREEAAQRTELGQRTVAILGALAALRREQEEAASRATAAAEIRGRARDVTPEPAALPETLGEDDSELSADRAPEAKPVGDAWEDLKPAPDFATAEPRAALDPPEPWRETAMPVSAPPVLRPLPIEYSAAEIEDSAIAGARQALTAAIAKASNVGWDEGAKQALVRDAMAAMGTRDVWAALDVTMTLLRGGTLFGLRGDIWVPLKDLLPAG